MFSSNFQHFKIKKPTGFLCNIHERKEKKKKKKKHKRLPQKFFYREKKKKKKKVKMQKQYRQKVTTHLQAAKQDTVKSNN